MFQIRAAAVSCVLPGNWPDTHRIVPSGEAITCKFTPMPFVFARIERPVCGDAVDRDQRAIEDHVGHALPLGLAQRRPKPGGLPGEQIDGLVDISPACRGRHREPGADLGERLALTQVHQHQHQQSDLGRAIPPYEAVLTDAQRVLGSDDAMCKTISANLRRAEQER
jgi:hypothetical protein